MDPSSGGSESLGQRGSGRFPRDKPWHCTLRLLESARDTQPFKRPNTGRQRVQDLITVGGVKPLWIIQVWWYVKDFGKTGPFQFSSPPFSLVLIHTIHTKRDAGIWQHLPRCGNTSQLKWSVSILLPSCHVFKWTPSLKTSKLGRPSQWGKSAFALRSTAAALLRLLEGQRAGKLEWTARKPSGGNAS